MSARNSEPSEDLASPCIRVCRLDPVEGRCLGCGRTAEEIARWPTATPAEKRAILARLAGRGRPDSRRRPT